MNKTPISPTLTITKDQIYHLGLDELEIYAEFLEPNIFVGINLDSSNYIEFNEFIVKKHEAKGYESKFTFAIDGITMFAYYLGKDKSDIVGVATKNYVCIHGSGFRLYGSDGIWNIFFKYFLPENDYPIKRFDICIDILLPIDTIFGSLDPTTKKTATFRGVGGNMETYYIGEKLKTNKRQLIRIYDKIADITKSKKYKLYSEYLAYDNITRVEIELRREVTRHISIIDIYNEKILLGIFKKYIDIHTDLFLSLEVEKESFHKKQEEIKFDILQSRAYFEFRTKLMISYAKGLYGFGMCPTEILLGEGLIQEQTKIGLGYSKYATFIANLKHKQRKSFKRHYALGKEQEEVTTLLENIDNTFPDAIN